MFISQFTVEMNIFLFLFSGRQREQDEKQEGNGADDQV